ncbi:hypothetical protein MO973_44420 [Paenibacillus sp. TRM 82003]|nr:hypothetical protein [Paenibacillus sp. TRM 82003]
MIDIHCHILPGVDDGAKDMEMSLAMARAAVKDGVRTIVCTSHYTNGWRVDRALVASRLEQVRAALAQHDIPLRLLPGNEVRLESLSFVLDGMRSGSFYYLADNPGFLLLEQAWEGFNPDTNRLVERLLHQGTRPILAHPERHMFFRMRPSLLEELLAMGAWSQVNVGSLLGENGPDAQAFAYDLLDRGLLHTIGTDAHNLTRRPNLSLGFAAIEARAGVATAQAIRERMTSIVPA